jgi:hypothetical protein
MDGEATFVKVDFTDAGEKLYEEAEREYGEYLNRLKKNFS